MKTYRVLGAAALCAAIAAYTLPVEAQTHQRSRRDRGTMAAGGDVGFANPTGDEDFDAELILDGWFEYFQTPNLGWRGMISMVDFDGPSPPPGRPRADVDLFFLDANALWHFRGEKNVRPFVTGGLGFYDFDAPGEDDLEPGMNMGGGVDVFVAPQVALKFEALLHATAADQEPDSLFTGTGGVRFEW